VGATATVVPGYFGEDDAALLGSLVYSAPAKDVDDLTDITALVAAKDGSEGLYTVVVSATFVPSTEAEFLFRVTSQHSAALFVDGRAVLVDAGCWTPGADEVAVWLTVPVNLTLIAASCGGYNNLQFEWRGGAQREWTTSVSPFLRAASDSKLSNDLTCVAGCPPGWIRISGRCFVVPAKKAKQDVAAAYCRQLGGHLAVIPDDFQNQGLHALTGGSVPMWIGLQRAHSDGDFAWADGAAFTWDRWAVNNPRSKHGCAQMLLGGRDPLQDAEQWISASCDGPPAPFACSVLATGPGCETGGAALAYQLRRAKAQRYLLEPNCSSHADCRYGTYCFDLERYSTGDGWGGNGRCSALHDPYQCCGIDTDAIDRDRSACPAWLRCDLMLDNEADNTVCGCDISSPAVVLEFAMSATQLTATSIIMGKHRPVGMGTRLTKLYFAASLTNNIVYQMAKVIMKCFPYGSDSVLTSFILHFFSMTGLSLLTIIIMESLMVAKLKSMGKLDATTTAIYKTQRVVVSTLCVTIGLAGASARYRPTASEEDLLWYDSVFVAMIFLFFVAFLLATRFGVTICLVFYEAWQATSEELREGGAADMATLARTHRAVKIQFLSALGGMATASLFFVANGMEQARSLHGRIYVDEKPDERLAQLSSFFLFVAVFVDSICNDLCSHWMMLTVFDGSLRQAQTVIEDRVERAAKELRQHDVAMQAMQAGPTSLERSLELMQRERHVRALLLQQPLSDEAISTAWAAVRSLATAEAQRINQLLRCVRLRAMIMPLRYQILHDLPSLSAKPRQPVPKEFQGGTQADAFFEYLVQVANSEHKNFVAMLEKSVEVFNQASSPGELGLDQDIFPFKIWRDGKKQKAVHEAEESVVARMSLKKEFYKPSIGEVVRVTDEGAEISKRNGNHAYFLGFSSNDDLLLQISGRSRPLKLNCDRIRACRGAAVLVPGPVKTQERMKEKLRSDYKNEPYPQAASILDILRATIVLDDPYALAVCAAYIQKEFAAVRLKNRFASDSVESVSVDRLLSEFYSAELVGGAASTALNGNNDASHDLGGLSHYTQQYRDINLSIAVDFPGRETKFVCEVQLTLSAISILKKSEQKIYSLLRMENPAELLEQYVFSRKTEDDESTTRTSKSAMSSGSDASIMPKDYASALSAVGLTSDTPQTAPLGEIDDEHRGQAQHLPEVLEDNEPGPKTVVAFDVPRSDGLPAARVGATMQAQLLDDFPVETEGTSRSALLGFGVCGCSDSRFADAIPCGTGGQFTL
jgi:hypothetical protein